ncbi:hypothetical protein ACFVZD_36985, partial [Streptomyces sp. NPDC058287]|uniref:hypothetical protein n=1 Tax=Streptomyces sp. NPDC058287 TaxID=3346423 RepID=UPI0036E6A1E9
RVPVTHDGDGGDGRVPGTHDGDGNASQTFTKTFTKTGKQTHKRTRGNGGLNRIYEKNTTPVQRQAVSCLSGFIPVGKGAKVLHLLTTKQGKQVDAAIRISNYGVAAGQDVNTGDSYNLVWDTLEFKDPTGVVVGCVRLGVMINQQINEATPKTTAVPSSKLGKVGSVKIQPAPGVQQNPLSTQP